MNWTAAVPESTAEQMNASILLVAVCTDCTKDVARRANAYNAERRWLTADAQEDLITAGVSQHWVIIISIILLGLGILTGATRTREKDENS